MFIIKNLNRKFYLVTLGNALNSVGSETVANQFPT